MRILATFGASLTLRIFRRDQVHPSVASMYVSSGTVATRLWWWCALVVVEEVDPVSVFSLPLWCVGQLGRRGGEKTPQDG